MEAAGKARAAEAEASKAAVATVLAKMAEATDTVAAREVAAMEAAATGAGKEEVRAEATGAGAAMEVVLTAMAAVVSRETTCQQTAYPSTLRRQHQCSARQTRRQGSRSAQ